MKILVMILLISGLAFFTGGSIGILRLPDFYSRLHPAGKLDTAGQLLTLSAIALYVSGCRGSGRPQTLDKGKSKMIWQIELVVLLIVVICGIGAITVKDLLGAAILFGAYSFMMCLLWAIMGAVDVAFTEASVGAGISTVLFVAAVFRTSRRTKD
jgi:monovalent cation/proton antiporter MnhG/PhaG subunit